MTEEKKNTILLVDDEENILNSIYRLLRREKRYEVFMANSGAEGLEILKSKIGESVNREIGESQKTYSPVSLIISDQRMPVMEGVEFLAKSKAISPDTTRVMLTGYADINAVTAAINRGEIFKYITKPWEDETLLAVVKQGIEQYELITERKHLLELTKKQNEDLKDLNQNLEKKVDERTKEVQDLYKELKANFYDTIRVFVNLVEHYDAYLGGHVKRVSIIAERFAKYLGLPDKEVEEIEIAALLHDIGLVGLPKIILAREPEDLSHHELALLKQHPAFAQGILSSIKNLQNVGAIIKSHHEKYDGSGYPDGLKGGDIPYGSRLLSICDTYDGIAHQRVNPEKGGEGAALYYIKSNRGTVVKDTGHVVFDPELAASFVLFMQNKKQVEEVVEREIALSSLAEGMVTAKEIVTESGKFLVSGGAVLNSAMIERLKNIHKIDPIMENICVRFTT